MSPAIIQYNQEALRRFLSMSVTYQMIKLLAEKASEVIQCDDSIAPSPRDASSRDDVSAPSPRPLPSLEAFICALVTASHVQVPTLMTTLVYLAKLKERLPPASRGMRCSVHRIFLAALILSAKQHNDSSPKNKHWARYTAVKGYDDFGFSVVEVSLMERQLLGLLDWQLRVEEEDLYIHFEPLLAPIRGKIALKETQKKREAEIRYNQQNLSRPLSSKNSSTTSIGSAASSTPATSTSNLSSTSSSSKTSHHRLSRGMHLLKRVSRPSPRSGVSFGAPYKAQSSTPSLSDMPSLGGSQTTLTSAASSQTSLPQYSRQSSPSSSATSLESNGVRGNTKRIQSPTVAILPPSNEDLTRLQSIPAPLTHGNKTKLGASYNDATAPANKKTKRNSIFHRLFNTSATRLSQPPVHHVH